MIKLKLKEACTLNGVELPSNSVVRTLNDKLARQLVEDKKAAVICGKLKTKKPKQNGNS